MKKRYIISICAVCIIVILLGSYAFSEYRKANQYAEDMDYYFKTVLKNNAYMENVPTNEVINMYIEKSKECKNDVEFLNVLLEANKTFGDAGHLFPLLPNNYYYRVYSYEYMLDKEDINEKTTYLYTNLTKSEVQKAYDSISNAFQCNKDEIRVRISKSLNMISNDNVEFSYINDTLFMTIKSFNLEYYKNDIEKIRKELKKFKGERIVFDIRDNGGGTGYYFLDLIRMTKYQDYRCKMITYGRGDILANHLKIIEPNIEVIMKDDEIILTDDIEIKSSHEFNFNKIYIITNENSYSHADSFAKMAKATGYATVIGKKTGGAGGSSLDILNFELPNTHFIVEIETTTTKPRETSPDLYSYAHTLEDFYNEILLFEKNN